MKLLQVCNVATRIGGTGACAWTIAKCLPDWRHCFAFPTRAVMPGVAEDFGHECIAAPNLRAEDIERVGADVVIYHNSSPYRIPQSCPPGVRSLYYQHSPHTQSIEARRRCDSVWSVSRYLADLAGLDPSTVVHQPVPEPPKLGGVRYDVPTVGRLCTPNGAKWQVDKVLPLYERLAADHPSVHWAFVGAPAAIEPRLAAALPGATFLPPSWSARSFLWNWHAVLYSGPPETYGRVACEAQRAGCVPVVDDAGGFREQIVHGQTGYLCRNADAFSEAVGAVLRGEIDRERMRAAGGDRGSLQAWRLRFLAWLREGRRV